MKRESYVCWTGSISGVFIIAVGVMFEKLLIILGTLIILFDLIVKIMVKIEMNRNFKQSLTESTAESTD